MPDFEEEMDALVNPPAKTYPKYQMDWTAGSKMFHVRSDDWTDFVSAIRSMETQVPEVQVAPPVTPAYAPGAAASGGGCKTCGGPVLPEKRIVGKDGRAWWVSDCATGDKSHKGPIRPAV